MLIPALFRAQPLRAAHFIIMAGSAIALIAAFISQYMFGLLPCELCILQRWPYALVIALSLLTLLTRSARAGLLLALCAVILLFNSGLAFYHAGVENKWFLGPAGCTDSGPAATSLEALKEQILSKPLVMCDQPAFQFLGLSMAGWNSLYAWTLFLFAAYIWAHFRRRPA